MRFVYTLDHSHTVIRYTIVPCTLGKLLVAGTEHGICAVSMADSERPQLQFLTAEYPTAEFQCDDAGLRAWSGAIVKHLAGKQRDLDLPIDVPATPFQRRVWQELCKIPYGQVTWYSHIAERIGRPMAIRAVARACATNPVAIVVPCHRVIGVDGSLRGYRWGLERKQAMIERETKRPIDSRRALDRSLWLLAS